LQQRIVRIVDLHQMLETQRLADLRYHDGIVYAVIVPTARTAFKAPPRGCTAAAPVLLRHFAPPGITRLGDCRTWVSAGPRRRIESTHATHRESTPPPARPGPCPQARHLRWPCRRERRRRRRDGARL